MAKRPRFSRWRRLPTVYRSGEHHLPDPGQEPQRISLYVPGDVLDRAEAQAVRLGFANAQEYCGDLLIQAIEAERVREQMSEVEARRGPLSGFRAIEDDPEYLAELRAAKASHESADPGRPTGPAEVVFLPDPPALEGPERPETTLPIHATLEREAPPPAELSASAWVVLRHAAQAQEDPLAFLPSLRRGEPVPPAEVAELAQALHQLELEYRGSTAMDRRLTFALHRLAFESQVLHTDAWPGSFDHWTVDMLRSVQEAVERILSGQDIRYQSPADGSLDYGAVAPPSFLPETPR